MTDGEIIRSRDNAKVKFARAVREGREPDFMFVEGVRLLNELTRSGQTVRHVLAASDFDISTLGFDEVTRIDRRVFETVADTENSQGVIAIAERPRHSLNDVSEGLTVLLHRVNNPTNLGAVVRTAEAAGAAGLITTTGSADAYSPKALRASMGSAFRLPIVERIDFEEAIEWGRSKGLVTTAADVSGRMSYTEIDWNVSRLVVFGSEAHGLGEKELAAIDEKIQIPMENEVESLNLAVSSGIILFEAKRQRMG